MTAAGAMPRPVRTAVLAGGIASALLAAGFVLRWSAVTELWPWPDGRYSFLFVGSILAAVAAAVAWIWWVDDVGMLAPGALNLTVTLGGSAAHLARLAGRRDESDLLVTAVVLGAGAVASAALWWWTRRFEPRDDRPLPTAARVAFVAFTVALVAAGIALITGAERLFPWELRDDTAVLFGWIFLGDACFFAYGVVRPRWAYAGPQLLAFLAYDLVLLGPFLALAGDTAAGHGTSLVAYTAVLVASALVAVWFLLVEPRTKVLGGR